MCAPILIKDDFEHRSNYPIAEVERSINTRENIDL